MVTCGFVPCDPNKSSESSALEADRSGAGSPCLFTSLGPSDESESGQVLMQTFCDNQNYFFSQNSEAHYIADGGSFLTWNDEDAYADGHGMPVTFVPCLSAPSRGNSAFKTRLCKNWEQTGTCQYADRCTFAHGEMELRSSVNSVSPLSAVSTALMPTAMYAPCAGQTEEDAKFPVLYKTRMCKNFAQTATCKFGDRCNFAHYKHELRRGSGALPAPAPGRARGAPPAGP